MRTFRNVGLGDPPMSASKERHDALAREAVAGGREHRAIPFPPCFAAVDGGASTAFADRRQDAAPAAQASGLETARSRSQASSRLAKGAARSDSDARSQDRRIGRAVSRQAVVDVAPSDSRHALTVRAQGGAVRLVFGSVPPMGVLYALITHVECPADRGNSCAAPAAMAACSI